MPPRTERKGNVGGRPRNHPEDPERDWSRLVFKGGINMKAWIFAEMEDAVSRAKRGEPPYQDRKGCCLLTFPTKLDPDKIALWEQNRAQWIEEALGSRGGDSFLSDLHRAREWMASHRQAHDHIGAAAFKIMTDHRRREGRLPTVKQMKEQLTALGIAPPINWARFAASRPMFRKLEAAKRGPDRADRQTRAKD